MLQTNAIQIFLASIFDGGSYPRPFLWQWHAFSQAGKIQRGNRTRFIATFTTIINISRSHTYSVAPLHTTCARGGQAKHKKGIKLGNLPYLLVHVHVSASSHARTTFCHTKCEVLGNDDSPSTIP